LAPRAVILGCQGAELTPWEADFFAATDPLGFILFARNCRTPDQVTALVAALRATVGRPDAPVLIDQEGGRVQRLKPPHWRATPPPGRFGDLALADRSRALEAVKLNAQCLAAELTPLGVSVNCLPLLDLRLPEAHENIGDRGFGADPDLVAALGRACCEGLLAGGVLPVIKHVPGHGRATVDSHVSLPRVEAGLAELEQSDFAPFRALRDMPWAMTGHVVYVAVDAQRPATTSPKVIDRVIRGWIGFDGVLVSDDLSMEALDGDLGARTGAALAAGCDIALHCNGRRAEMEAVAAAAGPLSAAALRRLAAAAARVGAPAPAQAEAAALAAELDALLAEA
jgi:beta-N-acetylhexosaminidase